MNDIIYVKQKFKYTSKVLFLLFILFIAGINTCMAVNDDLLSFTLSNDSPTSIRINIDANSGVSGDLVITYSTPTGRHTSDIKKKTVTSDAKTVTISSLTPDATYTVYIDYKVYNPSHGYASYATSPKSIQVKDSENGGSSATCEGDFWECAGNWFGGKPIENILDDPDSPITKVINQLMNMINIVGTAAFMIVTAYLGIRYMYGSIESKADIKESMITLIVAATFFFGWQSIMNIIYPGNVFVVTEGTTDFGSIVNRIYSVFVYIGNFFAIGAIIYIGVRYLLAGASGKADLKAKSTQFLLGVVMTFATINFLTYISKVINSVLQ